MNDPKYEADHVKPAYQLRYSWTGWPSKPSQLPLTESKSAISALKEPWEQDGLRVLESNLTPNLIQLTLSTALQVSPVMLATRIKGRLQHQLRKQGSAVDFSRKVSVRSVGDATRAEVEGYIRQQVSKEGLIDKSYQDLLQNLTYRDLNVDLAKPTESHSGSYWYNLHLVFVTQGRYRIPSETMLTNISQATLSQCAQQNCQVSTMAVMPDHLHLAVRSRIDLSPEDLALCLLNRLASIAGNLNSWQSGYYAGTFGEYSMPAVRSQPYNP